MKQHTLRDLFVNELKDLYNMENQIIKALPKMAKTASTPELRQGFEEHLQQTRGQVQRLERIFEELDTAPRGKRCMGMEGIIDEGKELMGEEMDEPTMDAGLIAAAQKVEHYEIASYGTVRTWAEELGMHNAASLLEETLEEEKATDEKLSHLAEQMVNQRAHSGQEEEAMAGSTRGRNGGNSGRSRR
jgi:ferritin-like metal-binding protein YciE